MEQKPKVLVVDDERINRSILEKVLGKEYEVFTAERAAEALEILSNDPDLKLIITDMRMPEMGGFEFIQEARKHYDDKQYFMLSGYAITEEVQRALDAKLISAYFTKPANYTDIKRALETSI